MAEANDIKVVEIPKGIKNTIKGLKRNLCAPGVDLSGIDQLRNFLRLYFLEEKENVSLTLFLDKHAKLISLRNVEHELLNHDEIFGVHEDALKHGAAQVVWAHYYPEGETPKIDEDKGLRRNLERSVYNYEPEVEIREYVVVSGYGYVAFVDAIEVY